MKINATAHLYYNEGDSISTGWEGLRLYVKFKEEGKIFKTRLSETLVSTFNVANAHLCSSEDRIDSYDDYYALVNETIEDKKHLKDVAADMIEKYFKNEYKESDKNMNRKELAKKVNNMPKFEVSVEIKK